MAAQLGLESVEELEAAIDSLEGIAPDGGELEPENLAREARVRSAYLEWCKEYEKDPDETRFTQFSSNYLQMEEYAQESGKAMLLNEYADCTEEEYVQRTTGVVPAVEKKSEPEVDAEVEEEMKPSAEDEAAAAKVKADEEAKIKAEQEAAVKVKADEEAKSKAAAEAAAKAKAAAEAKKAEEEKAEKYLAEKARLAAMTDEEIRQEIEKEKTERQNAQAKALEKERQAQEAAAIAAVSVRLANLNPCTVQLSLTTHSLLFQLDRPRLPPKLLPHPLPRPVLSKKKPTSLLAKRPRLGIRSKLN